MILFLSSFLIFVSGFAQTEEDPLKTLRKEHPRLILLDSDLARIRDAIRSEPLARTAYERLKADADKLETAETVKYEIIGPRLLTQSRRCLDRVYTLALLYRLDGERRYFDRTLRELHAAATFPDWNPSHFLDTAEMTHAFAIAYDWLYSALSAEQRTWIRRAIVEKGLDQAMPLYERQRGWVLARHNWNQVCNGGIGIGALAIADDEPDKARASLRYALKSLPLALSSYAPDGGWNEGPGYWHYATRYTVYFLAALETALGSDLGLSEMPGFHRAGHFRVYFSGPSAKTFNYADAGDAVGSASEMFWLARRFSQPVYAQHQQDCLRASKHAEALDLVWFQPRGTSVEKAHWPLDAMFEGVQTAFLRSSWNDPDGIFLAVKGGDNKANHSHLDLGSFVLDASGTRWAMDLGPDDYNLPQYFGAKRWTYYRLRTESHNTVLIDGENQDSKAAARVLEQRFEPQLARVRFDLAAAYPGKVSRLERAVSLVDRREAVIEDVVEARQPVEALWGMITDAEVRLNGAKAELRKGSRTLGVEIRSPRGAVFEVVSAAQPPPQRDNEGARKLVVRLPGKVTSSKIVVAMRR
ncbi:MAG: heparinase II/III family protein [Acidobacteria bacterium]|nr:heparinase II/III family protein [Acidobacteriota bacterium]